MSQDQKPEQVLTSGALKGECPDRGRREGTPKTGQVGKGTGEGGWKVTGR